MMKVRVTMKSEEIESINHERLGRWEKRLVDGHATPILLIGVGHDHAKGRIVICTLEDTETELVLGFLRFAVKELEGQGKLRAA